MFQVNDKVYCDYHKQAGTIISIRSGNSNYPIQVRFNNNSTDIYTKTGAINSASKPCLKICNTSDQYSVIKIERLASLITLSDGTRIYHPDSGQPFQLTTKETLI